MGSSQSNPEATTQSAPQSSSPSYTGNVETDGTSFTTDEEKFKTKKGNKKNLSGFDLVQHKCRRKRKAYDTCYAKLYGGFILAKEVENTQCDDVFDEWRSCILLGMKKEWEKQGLPPPNKESLLGELAEDNE